MCVWSRHPSWYNTHTHRRGMRRDRGVDNEQGKHKRRKRESSSSLRASLHLRSTEQSSANISVRLALEIMATHTHTNLRMLSFRGGFLFKVMWLNWKTEEAAAMWYSGTDMFYCEWQTHQEMFNLSMLWFFVFFCFVFGAWRTYLTDM